jgi:hypothetical protein
MWKLFYLNFCVKCERNIKMPKFAFFSHLHGCNVNYNKINEFLKYLDASSTSFYFCCCCPLILIDSEWVKVKENGKWQICKFFLIVLKSSFWNYSSQIFFLKSSFWNDSSEMILLKWFFWNDSSEMILLKWFFWNDSSKMIFLKWFFWKVCP